MSFHPFVCGLYYSYTTMDKYHISYKQRMWPMVEVTIFKGTPNQADVAVGTTKLEEELVNDLTSDIPSVSNEAYKLDVGICYYVKPEEMDLPCEDIARIVEASYE